MADYRLKKISEYPLVIGAMKELDAFIIASDNNNLKVTFQELKSQILGDIISRLETLEGMEIPDPTTIDNMNAGEQLEPDQVVGINPIDQKIYKCIANISSIIPIGISRQTTSVDNKAIITTFGKIALQSISFNQDDMNKYVYLSNTTPGEFIIASPNMLDSFNNNDVLQPIGFITNSNIIFIDIEQRIKITK